MNREGPAAAAEINEDFHVAIDELIGIRGPISSLLRNIIWLLAFNGAYLGLFAFIPFSIGSAVLTFFETSKISTCMSFVKFIIPGVMKKILIDISEEAAREDHILQLPDLGIILLG